MSNCGASIDCAWICPGCPGPIKDEPVHIYFSAPWCQPCKAIEPKVAEAVADGRLKAVMHVNTDEVDRSLLEDYLVIGVPTLLKLDKNGVVVDRATGPKVLRLL